MATPLDDDELETLRLQGEMSMGRARNLVEGMRVVSEFEAQILYGRAQESVENSSPAATQPGAGDADANSLT